MWLLESNVWKFALARYARSQNTIKMLGRRSSCDVYIIKYEILCSLKKYTSIVSLQGSWENGKMRLFLWNIWKPSLACYVRSQLKLIPIQQCSTLGIRYLKICARSLRSLVNTTKMLGRQSSWKCDVYIKYINIYMKIYSNFVDLLLA